MCFVIVLSACVVRKDNAAVERVTAKRPLIDRVRPFVMDLYPCANDTIQVWMPGQVDSVPYAVPVLNQEELNNIIDSLGMEYQGQCDEALRKAYLEGRASVKIPKRKPDTLRLTIVDRTLLASKNAEISTLKGEILRQIQINDECEKEKRSSLVMNFIGLAVLVLTLIASITKKFK
jgi:hypothetical protein